MALFWQGVKKLYTWFFLIENSKLEGFLEQV
jgi:hypothetical protein